MSQSDHPLSNQLLPSCRVALAAYLHDLGKFSQRARIPLDKNLIDDHKLQYCPKHPQGGWWSHVHAAYTALSFDINVTDCSRFYANGIL